MNSGRSPWENKLEDTTAMKKKTETTETTKKAEYDMEAHVRDSLYCRNQRKSAAFLILLGVILLASAVLSLWAGSYETPVGELLKGIFGQASDEKINIVVRNVRLPRICTAAAAGAGLGVTGCILQAILNNPLASASTLGVSQGAGFGAAFAIIILGAGTSGSGLGVSFCAFVGSMAVAVVIFALSKFRQVSAESIVLAGVAIFPAVFSFGLEPGQGPSLIFVTLPEIFTQMPATQLWSILFFFLLVVAALTSTVSVAEVTIAFLAAKFRMHRKKACYVTLVPLFLLSSICAMSLGPLSHLQILGKTIFDALDYLTSNIMLPVVAIFVCIYVGHVLPKSFLRDEMTNHGTMRSAVMPAILFIIRYIAPLLIAAVLINKLLR